MPWPWSRVDVLLRLRVLCRHEPFVMALSLEGQPFPYSVEQHASRVYNAALRSLQETLVSLHARVSLVAQAFPVFLTARAAQDVLLHDEVPE
jgi:hypothetical protein